MLLEDFRVSPEGLVCAVPFLVAAVVVAAVEWWRGRRR